jgi:hypothetical protein
MSRSALLLVALALLAQGCKDVTDLDDPCRLMRPDGDGGLVTIQVGDPNFNPNFDFISTGDSDCEDLVCVRIHNPSSTFYDDSDGTLHGRCSNNCIVDKGTNQSTDCGEPEKGLQCVQLSFDQKFIDGYCKANPADCKATFGDNTGATYCVDPLAYSSSSSQ